MKAIPYSSFEQKKVLTKTELTSEEKLIRVLDLMDLHNAIRKGSKLPKTDFDSHWIELSFRNSNDK